MTTTERMATIEPSQTTNGSLIPAEAVVRHIRFVPAAGAGQEVLLEFIDPAAHKAVCVSFQSELIEKNSKPDDGIEVLTVPSQPHDHLGLTNELLKWVNGPTVAGAPAPIVITIHGAQVIWSPTRAAIMASPDRVGPFLLALVDFCYYENELRKLEREIGESWPLIETDSQLASEVAVSDPDRFEDVGQRMQQALKRRMRLARIVPHLNQPRAHLPPLANQLLERLRNRAHVEARQESIVVQLDAFERIYEMTSQRISDFKEARKGHMLEWIIIVLLAAETVLLLIEMMWQLGV